VSYSNEASRPIRLEPACQAAPLTKKYFSVETVLLIDARHKLRILRKSNIAARSLELFFSFNSAPNEMKFQSFDFHVL
jgi:hypothetical protein